MKISFLALLFIPLLSFSQEDVETQLSRKDKKKIDKYALEMCNCVNDKLSELHPKALDIIVLISETDEDDAMVKIQAMFEEMEMDEKKAVLASVEKMESPEFLAKIEKCDNSEVLGEELKTLVETQESAAHDYLGNFFNNEENCLMVNKLIILGEATEE